MPSSGPPYHQSDPTQGRTPCGLPDIPGVTLRTDTRNGGWPATGPDADTSGVSAHVTRRFGARRSTTLVKRTLVPVLVLGSLLWASSWALAAGRSGQAAVSRDPAGGLLSANDGGAPMFVVPDARPGHPRARDPGPTRRMDLRRVARVRVRAAGRVRRRRPGPQTAAGLPVDRQGGLTPGRRAMSPLDTSLQRNGQCSRPVAREV